MKKIIHKLRMALCLMSIFGFWCISVSGTSSLIDRPANKISCLYRSSIDPQKDFQDSIAHRWTRQKISMPLSLIDGPVKRFPCLYRSSIDPQKDFQASIAHRWGRERPSLCLSLIDRPAKRFPCLYRSSIDPFVKNGRRYAARTREPLRGNLYKI